jgi:putative DNA primase/helicase
VAVIDEGFWSAALTGQDGHGPQLALSAIEDDRTGSLTGIMRQRVLDLRGRAVRALRHHERGALLRAAFEAEGFTAEGAKEWQELEWKAKPKVAIGEGMDRAAILSALEDAAEAGFTRLRPMLARYVHELLTGDAARSINAEFVPDANLGRHQGSGPVVRFAWREDFAEWIADAPKLFLDATTAPEVLRAWSPKIEVVDIEITAPRQHVRQAIGKEFGRVSMTLPHNVSRLADLVVVELAEAAGGEVLVVAQQAVETALWAELQRRLGTLPDRLHLAHHGAVTGMNKWQDVARVVVVGRPAVNRLDGERLAEIVRGGPVERVQDGELAHWPRVPAGVRRTDGTGAAIQQPHHPDPLVEGLRWSIAEGAVLQAIGRARGVRRAEPVTITLLGNMALPLTVAEITGWEGLLPDRLTVATAEAALRGRALPLAPADMAAARPDLWPSAKAAERFFEERSKTPQTLIGVSNKGLGGFSGLTLASYRKPGARRSSKALVPIEDGKAALQAVVGELAAFELVPDGQPVTEAEARPIEAAAPEPVEPVGAELPVEAHLVGSARLIVLGEDAPFVDPFLPAPPPPLRRLITGHDRAMLAHLSQRLERVRPPKLWGDFTDPLRIEGWRARCAAAREQQLRCEAVA